MANVNGHTMAVGKGTVGKTDVIWNKNFTLLCLIQLFAYIVVHSFIPTMPLLITALHGSPKDIGFVMGTFGLCSVVARPFAGTLVDRYGRKKFMLIGIVLIILIAISFKFAAVIVLLAVLRGLHGLANGITGTAVGTLVADNLPRSRLNQGMGFFGLTSSISMALAPVIGMGLVEKAGYDWFFGVIVAIALLGFILATLVKVDKTPIIKTDTSLKKVLSGLLEKNALPPSAVMFFLGTIFGSVLFFASQYAAERDISNIGLFFTANALAMLVSRPLSGKLADSGRTGLVLIIGHLALLFGIVLLSFSYVFVSLLVAGILIGLGMGFCIPILQAWALRNAPAHRRGAATATFLSSADLGFGLGTMILGYVVSWTSFQTMYLSTLVSLFFAAIICRKFWIGQQTIS